MCPEGLNSGLYLTCSFLCKTLLQIIFVQNFSSSWFSTFRNSWMEIFSKDFCRFTGVYTAIYMGACHSPTSYLPNYFELSRTNLFTRPIKPVFLISSKLFSRLLQLKFEYWITFQLCRFTCTFATVIGFILEANFGKRQPKCSYEKVFRKYVAIYREYPCQNTISIKLQNKFIEITHRHG